jgi:hypothetical protein
MAFIFSMERMEPIEVGKRTNRRRKVSRTILHP